MLIWLHNDETEIEQDIKPTLAKARLDQTSSVPIYLIDNSRASFLLKVVDNLKNSSPDGRVEFFYPKIGTAVDVKEGRTGAMVPLELVAADIIPGLIRKGDIIQLAVYAHQSLSVDAYKKLIAYGLQFGSGLATVIKIGMLDFNPATDSNTAQQARLAFSARPEKIDPFNFNRTILDLIEGVTE